MALTSLPWSVSSLWAPLCDRWDHLATCFHVLPQPAPPATGRDCILHLMEKSSPGVSPHQHAWPRASQSGPMGSTEKGERPSIILRSCFLACRTGVPPTTCSPRWGGHNRVNCTTVINKGSALFVCELHRMKPHHPGIRKKDV